MRLLMLAHSIPACATRLLFSTTKCDTMSLSYGNSLLYMQRLNVPNATRLHWHYSHKLLPPCLKVCAPTLKKHRSS